jgi:hypothetical protein
MAMELAVAVEKRLDVQLPVMLLGEGPSIHRLAERIVALMRKGGGGGLAYAGVEDTVRAVAARHGQAVDDPHELSEVVRQLTAAEAASERR